MSPTAALAKPAARPEPAVIVFGLDHSNKPHASAFGADLAGAATASAKAMGMASLKVTSSEQRQLADRLPAGKLFGSGKAFVPFVKASVFDQIVKLAPPEMAKLATKKKLRVVAGTAGDEAGAPSSGQPTPSIAPHFPTDWSQIKIGSHVLAHESPDDGWWESVVLEVKTAELLRLRWRDYPEMGDFFRSRWELGLMPLPKAEKQS